MKARSDITNLKEIPNVGPATIKYFAAIDIHTPYELIGQDPYLMYENLCTVLQKRFDPCLADVFISAVRYMEGAPPKNWWEYTEERKRNLKSTPRNKKN